jgi:hypothetical protein
MNLTQCAEVEMAARDRGRGGLQPQGANAADAPASAARIDAFSASVH